jgi:PilZ domain-containing protein
MMSLVREDRLKLSPDPTGGAERRRGLRISQHRPIKLYEPWSTRFIGGQTRDVSATGLRIELPKSAPVQPGKLVCIHVGLDGQGHGLVNRRSMIPARVVWIRRDVQQRMTAGVEFLASISAHQDAA